MKKIIAIAVLAALVLSLAACSPINSAPVAVLWATDSEAISPNSLINAMDRALYIENISYTYYGAEGDAAKQLAQAEEALNAGCAVLMVEPVDAAAAAQFVELANAKQTPVIFFGANVEETVATESSLCLIVKTDAATLAEKYTEMLTEYLKDEKTVNAMHQVYLDASVTNQDIIDINKVLEADNWQILVVAEGVQSEGYDDAYTALNTAFGVPGSYDIEWPYQTAKGEE